MGIGKFVARFQPLFSGTIATVPLELSQIEVLPDLRPRSGVDQALTDGAGTASIGVMERIRECDGIESDGNITAVEFRIDGVRGLCVRDRCLEGTLLWCRASQHKYTSSIHRDEALRTIEVCV